MEELQILLVPDKEHQKLFPYVPIVGFHNGKRLKDHLDTFSPITTDETFKINKGPLNCNSKKVVYLSECRKCKNLYVGKAQTKFRMRLNNYKSSHISFKTKKRETQKVFHGHYIQDDLKGKDDWQLTLIDQFITNAEL